MKLLWNWVMPMLQCWKILVPVKMFCAFDSAISSLENLTWKPDMIELMLLEGNAQGAPKDDGGQQQPLMLYSYPP